jgi:hypothetical protein
MTKQLGTIALAAIVSLAADTYAQTGKEKANPEGEQYKRALAKMIKDGHVNKVCQDMKGTWETVDGAEGFRVCRPEKGFIHDGRLVAVLEAYKARDGGGILTPQIFDCAGRRSYHNQSIYYDFTGKIELHAPEALGGAWVSIEHGTKVDAILSTVCKGVIQ